MPPPATPVTIRAGKAGHGTTQTLPPQRLTSRVLPTPRVLKAPRVVLKALRVLKAFRVLKVHGLVAGPRTPLRTLVRRWIAGRSLAGGFPPVAAATARSSLCPPGRPGTWAEAALIAGALALLTAGPALAQSPGSQLQTVGPGRIVCNASFCELGSGVHPEQRFRVDVSALPQAEFRRLRKCTGVSKPCIVAIDGTRLSGSMKIVAESIRWQD
jgi:hypothetical protein